MLPLSASIWNRPSDFVPFWATVEPVHFCAILFVTGSALALIRPTNVEESLLHPASFQYHFSGYFPMLFSPFFVCLFAQQRQSWLQPNTLLLMLCCSSNRLFWPAAEAFSSYPLDNRISYQRFCRLQKSRYANAAILHPNHRVSHITAPARPPTCLHI